MSFKWKQMKISLVLQKIFYIGITYFENWLTYWLSGFVLKWNKMIVNHLKSGMWIGLKTRFRLKPKCAGYNQCVSENKHKKYLQIFLKIKLLHIDFDLRIIFGWSGYVYKHTQKLMKVARKSAISDVVAAKHKKALRAKAKVVNHCRY